MKLAGFEIFSYPFFGSKATAIVLYGGSGYKKALYTILGFLKRVYQLFNISKFDAVYIQRNSCIIGPPIFEWIYSKVFRRKIILDFDDAIWMNQPGQTTLLDRIVKYNVKLKSISKWSSIILVGNKYLADYALMYNKNVVLMPTSVDTDLKYNKKTSQMIDEKLRICWTGSFSTNMYLEMLESVFTALSQKIDFELLVLSNVKPNLALKNMVFIPWNEQSEVSELAKCQIGIMPMEKNEWSKGKCGFKIIQYMSLGVVPVADNWGANDSIINHGYDGILIEKTSEWVDQLVMLAINTQQRLDISKRAIKTAETKFSVNATFPVLRSSFEKVVF